MIVCAGPCGREIRRADAYQEVIGFVKDRVAGGANHIKAIEPTGRWMCGGCLAEQAVDAKMVRTEPML